MKKPPPLPYLNPSLYAEPPLSAADEAKLADVRNAIGKIYNEIVDRSMAEFDRDTHKQWIAQDIALMVMYLCTIRIGEQTGDMDRRQLLSAFHHLLKRAQAEIPERILMFCTEVLRQPQPGAMVQ